MLPFNRRVYSSSTNYCWVDGRRLPGRRYELSCRRWWTPADWWRHRDGSHDIAHQHQTAPPSSSPSNQG